jgi:predicted DNA-binding transcriptional regulator YafY
LNDTITDFNYFKSTKIGFNVMSDIRDKIKRQIELLGMVLNRPENYKIVDFEVIFNCNEATIKRDLKELRAQGVDIHSISRRGVRVESSINQKVLNDLVNDYLLLNNSSINIEKPTHFLVNSKKESALSNLALIQHCIDRNLIAKILYKKRNKKTADIREIAPITIFYGQNEYRLFALENGVYKQFLLSGIGSVEITRTKFKPIDKNKFESRFATSLDVWLGEKTYKIKLMLMKPWYTRRKLPLLTENQTIIKNTDGSLLLEAEVNSLIEFSKWVVTQGRGIKVIEPKELQKLVLDLAREAFENQQSK